jgi:hypothetical protein
LKIIERAQKIIHLRLRRARHARVRVGVARVGARVGVGVVASVRHRASMRRVVVARRPIFGVMVSNSVWLFMMPRARRRARADARAHDDARGARRARDATV